MKMTAWRGRGQDWGRRHQHEAGRWINFVSALLLLLSGSLLFCVHLCKNWICAGHCILCCWHLLCMHCRLRLVENADFLGGRRLLFICTCENYMDTVHAIFSDVCCLLCSILYLIYHYVNISFVFLLLYSSSLYLPYMFTLSSLFPFPQRFSLLIHTNDLFLLCYLWTPLRCFCISEEQNILPAH